MNQLLLDRSTGSLGPNAFARLQTTKLLHSFAPAPQFRFDGGTRGIAVHRDANGPEGIATVTTGIWAHQAGVNALAVERFTGRILVSCGSDGSIKLWDLESYGNSEKGHTFRPMLRAQRSSNTHRVGITHVSFFPNDSGGFLTSSYDNTLKVWLTDTASVGGTFALGAKVYTHAISPIGGHMLVACGTQHPNVRLVDLRTSANLQSLVGHTGAVLATAWSPRHEHVLATGSVDGTVRIWDIRRSGGAINMLDKEDSLGIYYNGLLQPDGSVRVRQSAKAHFGPVNSLTWTDDGNYIVSAGQDRRIRVWDAITGANTLASFGPGIRNSQLASVTMFTSATGLTDPRKQLLFWPNETEILIFGLHNGQTITKLRNIGPAIAGVRGSSGSQRSVQNRITALAWRGAGGEAESQGLAMGGSNMPGAIISAHLDGQIRAWVPRLEGCDEEDESTDEAKAEEEKAKKRKAIDGVFRSLMGRQITFS
ncbi:WD40-repeat-containing domain protein [Xylariales sp. PMI_506]|nr:WD40-repeat-containing domain protein [Xylariales sp. PMI_506]